MLGHIQPETCVRFALQASASCEVEANRLPHGHSGNRFTHHDPPDASRQHPPGSPADELLIILEHPPDGWQSHAPGPNREPHGLEHVEQSPVVVAGHPPKHIATAGPRVDPENV